MNNTTKLTMLTILTAGILMSSFMLANSNPTFAKKKQCDKPDTVCQSTTNDVKTTKSLGQKGKDGTNGISKEGTSMTGKSGASVTGKDGANGTSNEGKDGTAGNDVAKGISVSSKHGNNDSNVVEEQTQLDNSSASASASAPPSAIDNTGSANPFDLPM